MSNNIHWHNYFDKVYCIHYLPQVNKLQRLHREMWRVGLLPGTILEMRYTSPSPYDALIYEKFRDANLCPSVVFVNLCLEIRKILAEALDLNYQKVLLLEDDVAFLKDTAMINRILDFMPSEYDIIQLDKLVTDNGWMKDCWNKRLAQNRINDFFIDATGALFTSAACMALSRKGIEEMYRVMNERIVATDVAPCLMKNCKYAVAIKNLAVQVLYGGSNSSATVDIKYFHNGYKNGGVDYSEYNLPEGYGFGKTFNG